MVKLVSAEGRFHFTPFGLSVLFVIYSNHEFVVFILVFKVFKRKVLRGEIFH